MPVQDLPPPTAHPDPGHLLGTENENLDLLLVLQSELIANTSLTSADTLDWADRRLRVGEEEEVEEGTACGGGGRRGGGQ